MSTPEPRLPYAPLEEYILARHRHLSEEAGDAATLGIRRIADMLHVGSSTVERWKRDGALSVYSADRAAVALGQHAWAIWDDEWWAGCEDEEVAA